MSKEKYRFIFGSTTKKALRCQAMSKRTKLQCAAVVKPSNKNQICRHHGGRSTGPKTQEGKQRIAEAQLIHGNETIKKRLARQNSLKDIKQLEDIMHVLNMTTANKTPGAKPKGYSKITTIEQANEYLNLLS